MTTLFDDPRYCVRYMQTLSQSADDNSDDDGDNCNYDDMMNEYSTSNPVYSIAAE
jgi:hypothetical protein